MVTFAYWNFLIVNDTFIALRTLAILLFDLNDFFFYFRHVHSNQHFFYNERIYHEEYNFIMSKKDNKCLWAPRQIFKFKHGFIVENKYLYFNTKNTLQAFQQQNAIIECGSLFFK